MDTLCRSQKIGDRRIFPTLRILDPHETLIPPDSVVTDGVDGLNKTYESLSGYEAEVYQIDISPGIVNCSQCSQARYHILFVKPDKLLIKGDYDIEAFNNSVLHE